MHARYVILIKHLWNITDQTDKSKERIAIMKRKIITMLLACCMTASMVPTAGMASETELPAETETEAFFDMGETETEVPLQEAPDLDIAKYLTITDDKYRNIEVTVSPVAEVLDEDVDDEILNEASYADVYDKKTEGTVEDGDTVNIDYVGKKDGEAFDGGTAEDQDLTIGSGQFIDGFESGLIGKKIGDTVDLNLTFPEDYGASDLAGQDVVFTVTINFVKETPEITDDMVDQLTDGEYKKADDYRAYVRKNLEAENESEQKKELYYNILTELIQLYPLDEESYPQDYIDYYVNKNLDQLTAEAEAAGSTLDDFLKLYQTDKDQMTQYFEASAKQLLQQRILLGAIGAKENVTLSDEDFSKILQGYADQYGTTSEDILAAYRAQNVTESEVRESEYENKVMEHLAGIIKVTEVEETESDTEDYEDLIIETEAETEN